MQNSMLLTPASPVLSRPLGRVKLGSRSAIADASDWLPLAVGNSWTYSHNYYENDGYENDDENDDVYSQFHPFGVAHRGH